MLAKTANLNSSNKTKKHLKIALVHDYLNQYGGAERVFEVITEIFPESPIYTLFYDKKLMNGRFLDKKIKTSFLDNPFVRKNHRLFIPFFAKAIELINLKDKYDIIISDSSGFGKGISYKNGYHINYSHSPLRYAWEPKYYLGTLFSKAMILAGMPIISYIRRWDKKMGQRPNYMFANSLHTAKKIKDFYGRIPEVLHPPIDTKNFFFDPPHGIKGNYFLAFGRFIHYKRFDLIIETFNRLNMPIIILGTGPHHKEIKKLITSKNIKLINEHIDDKHLRRIISGAKATIFPQVEDFGLVALESIACGTPVIAFNEGGAKEIISSGKNGILFKEQTVDALRRAIHEFNSMQFNPHTVSETAQKFSKENFKRRLLEIVHSI